MEDIEQKVTLLERENRELKKERVRNCRFQDGLAGCISGGLLSMLAIEYVGKNYLELSQGDIAGYQLIIGLPLGIISGIAMYYWSPTVRGYSYNT